MTPYRSTEEQAPQAVQHIRLHVYVREKLVIVLNFKDTPSFGYENNFHTANHKMTEWLNKWHDKGYAWIDGAIYPWHAFTRADLEEYTA